MKCIKLTKKIKTLRTDRAWSQSQLAEITSLSSSTVQRLEVDGKCSHENLLALASACHLDFKELTALLNNNENSETKFFFSLFNSNANFEWFKSCTAFIAGILMAFPAIYFIIVSILKYCLRISSLFDPLQVFYS